MTAAETGEGVKKLAAAFSVKRQTPRYLLLIDGYNELPENSVKLLNKELQEFLTGGRYDSIRVVISGRTVDESLPESEFAQVEMQQLGKNTVEKYLHKAMPGRNSLLKILRIPMYLKLFADTDTHGDIQNKADLLREFVLWQEGKDEDSAAERRDVAQYHILLRHLLPIIAYDMVLKKQSFVLTEDELEAIIEDAIERLCSSEYRKYHGPEYRALLNDIDYKHLDSLDLMDAAVQYYVRVCKIWHQDGDGNFEFVHQVYRDFFCAWYLAEEVGRSLEKGVCSDALACKMLYGDVLEFVADLLKEKPVRMHWQTYCWDFSCNNDSPLVKLLALCRQANPSVSAIVVANIVNMLRYARQNNLAGLNFSGLDLTNTRLQECNFFQFDRSASYTTNFAGATINKENLFEEPHDHPLRAACTNETLLACLDEGGFLKLWEKRMKPLFPVKTITDVHYSVKQMIFAPDGSRLYAMTDHEILEILIPDARVSQGQIQLLYRSGALLQQIKLDVQGQLLFSTVANAYNFKKLSDPQEEDAIAFYGSSTATAVNAAGTCLAYGRFIGYEGLQIWDRKEDGSWQERIFGYAQLLEELVLDLEALFRQFGKYHYFANENADLTQRCGYFTTLQQRFMDRTHDFYKAPQKIKKRCLETLGIRDVLLDEEEERQLDALVQHHQQRISTVQDEQGTLLYLNGRRITGLDFHPDNRTLLISGIIDYQEKFRLSKKQPRTEKLKKETSIHSLIAILDTQTLEARELKVQQGTEPCRAFYCGDDIVVIQKSKVRVYHQNGTCVASVKISRQQLQLIVAAPWKDTFYVANHRYIYELDRNMRCICSIHNSIKDEKLCFFWDSFGGEYLCARSAVGKDTPPFYFVSGPVISLLNGVMVRHHEIRCKAQKGSTNTISIGDMRFVLLNDRLVSFCGLEKCGEISIQQDLHICGCDFTDIRGTAAEPASLQILWQMGGKTDVAPPPPATEQHAQEIVIPSKEAFVLPEVLPDNIFAHGGEMTLRDECRFLNIVDQQQLVAWQWATIQHAMLIRNDMDDTDYSMLEWVNLLKYATEDMIKDLVDAELIATPTQHPNVGKRLVESLHRYYKLLIRSRLYVNDVPTQCVLLTVNQQFGPRLMKHVADIRAKDSLEVFPGGRSVQEGERKILIRQPNVGPILKKLRLNKWFSVTAKRHKLHLEDHALDIVMETNCHYNGFARVQGYLRFGGQAFFGQSFSILNGGKPDSDLRDKVARLCILAQYYATLKAAGHQLDGMARQPIIVLIGENLEQCRQLNDALRYTYPNVRKLFTFDALLQSEAAAQGAGNYFEFCDDGPHSVRLETLMD